MPKDPNAILSPTTAGDAAFSCGFPNYMSGFDAPSDITYKTMEFTSKEFKLHELSGIYDPANPDLSAFARAGGNSCSGAERPTPELPR